MAMTPYTGEVETIAKIGTTPQERGMDTPDFKAAFSKDLKEFVTWLNDTHKTEFDAHVADNVFDADGAHGLKIESGTFTPVVAGNTAEGTNTYNYQIGLYRVVGSRVFCDVTLYINTKDAAMDGDIKIKGFPFAPKAVNNHRYAGTIGAVSNVNIGTSKGVSVLILGNTTEALLYKINDNAASSRVMASDVANMWLAMHINYEKA